MFRGGGVCDFAGGELAGGVADVDLGDCGCGCVCIVGVCMSLGGVVCGGCERWRVVSERLCVEHPPPLDPGGGDGCLRFRSRGR